LQPQHLLFLSSCSIARWRYSLCKKQICAWAYKVYDYSVQTAKTGRSVVPHVPVCELGSDCRWPIHWWPLGRDPV